jgi:hypothetical protein
MLVPLVDATAVPLTIGYSVPKDDITLPAKVAICEVDSVNAVVPAPEPVLISIMPSAALVIDAPLFVALPAVMIVDIIAP